MTPDGFPMGVKLPYFDPPFYIPAVVARQRVSVDRCKPCANPQDHGDSRSI